jgi:hypothetical protein
MLVFRPRMMTSRLKPIGTPAARRALRIGLKSETLRGTRAVPIRSLISVAPSCVDVFGCHTRDPQEGADVTAA